MISKLFSVLWLLAVSSIFLGCSNAPPKTETNSQANHQQQNTINKPIIRRTSLNKLINTSRPFGISLISKNNPLFIGQKLKLYLTSKENGYASLLTISSSGKVFSLLSNKPINSYRSLKYPAHNSLVDYELSHPKGIETYILIVTKQPLRLLEPNDKIGFNMGLTGLNMNKQKLVIRINNRLKVINNNNWNLDFLELKLN